MSHPHPGLAAPPSLPKRGLRIVGLGGLGEIGRNMTVFEYAGRLLIVDCGVLFPEPDQPGVDLILPDFSYLEGRLDQVEAVVLTHAHEDHIGAVPYLLRERPDITLAGSKLTLALVKSKLAEHRLTPLWWIGLPRGPVPAARVYPQKDALVSVGTVLAAHGVAPGRPYAVLQPGAAFATRRWRLENFVPLAEWLASEWKLVPIVLLGPGERELRAEAASAFGGFRPPAVVVEGLDLRQLAALLSQARLFVGHDTGPTHVAAAAGP